MQSFSMRRSFLSQAQINLIVIVDESEWLAGVISKTDIVRQIVTCSGNSCTITVASVMTRKVVPTRRMVGGCLGDDAGARHRLPVTLPDTVRTSSHLRRTTYARAAVRLLACRVDPRHDCLRASE